jgi:hypothetical protein
MIIRKIALRLSLLIWVISHAISGPVNAVVFHVSSTATGGGSGSLGSPLTLSEAKGKIITGVNLEVELRFLPGTYTLATSDGFFNPGAANTNPKKLALIGVHNGTTPGECILRWADNVVAEPASDDVTPYHYMVGGHPLYSFDRFVIENMTLDGNFLGQGGVVGPHYREGYKSAGIEVRAKTGRIRNCLLRNFGSRGPVPYSLSFPAGVEAFPILVTADDPAAIGSDWPQANGVVDSHAWVIEDNELCELQFQHQGYATAGCHQSSVHRSSRTVVSFAHGAPCCDCPT